MIRVTPNPPYGCGNTIPPGMVSEGSNGQGHRSSLALLGARFFPQMTQITQKKKRYCLPFLSAASVDLFPLHEIRVIFGCVIR